MPSFLLRWKATKKSGPNKGERYFRYAYDQKVIERLKQLRKLPKSAMRIKF